MEHDVTTPTGAAAYVAGVTADPAHPARDAGHPRHQEASDRKRVAYQTLHPAPAGEPAGPTLPEVDANPRGVRDWSAAREIARIRQDPAHPYHHPHHPQHRAAAEGMRALYVTAYGSGPIPGQEEPPGAAPGKGGPRVTGPTGESGEVDDLAAAAAEVGISREEVAGWLAWAAQPGPRPEQAATVATLQAEWGARYQENLTAAQLVAERLGAQGLLDESGLGDDPALIRRLAAVGRPLLLAFQEINATRADQDHPANIPGHRQHQAARARLRSLYVTVYGSRKVE